MSGHQRPRAGLFDRMAGPGEARGPNLYGGVNQSPEGGFCIAGQDVGHVPGVEFGGSVFTGGGRDERTGLYGNASVLYADAFAGGRSDGRIGIGGRAGLFNGTGGIEGNGHYLQFSHDILSAEAGAFTSDSETGFTAGANIIGGGIEMGQRNAERSDDQSFGVGASFGSPSIAGSLIHSDTDGDGHREYGFSVGGRLGPGVNLRYTTEDPVRSALTSSPLLNNPLGQAAVDRVIGDRNLTDTALSAGRSALDWVGSWFD